MEKFRCGAAKKCITPPENLIPDLRGLMDQKLGAVLDDLYVRVIAMSNGDDTDPALFVCFELDKVPQEKRYYALLKDTVGAREENITLTAVHTHSAPISGYRPFEGPNFIDKKPQEVQTATHAYEDFLAEQLKLAAQDAVRNMEPARFGVGAAKSYIGIDRKQWYTCKGEDGKVHRKLALGNNPEGDILHDVTILRFQALDGRDLAMIIHHPVHCCILHTNKCGGDGRLGISPDLGGAVSRMLEQTCPGAAVIWCSGAAGDINPVMQNEIYYPDPITGDQCLRSMPGGDIVYLLDLVAANHCKDVQSALAKICCTEGDVPLGGTIEWSRTPGLEGEYEIRMHMLRIGDVYILGGSGEFYNQYAEILRGILPEKYALVLNHEASLAANSGYIIDTYTASAPEKDLPGTGKLNMNAGLVEQSFAEHAVHMYNTLR